MNAHIAHLYSWSPTCLNHFTSIVDAFYTCLKKEKEHLPIKLNGESRWLIQSCIHDTTRDFDFSHLMDGRTTKLDTEGMQGK